MTAAARHIRSTHRQIWTLRDPEESDERFDADILLTSQDPYLLPEAIETAGWVEGICREHLAIGVVVKVLLLVMAELGYCSCGSPPLDGAAALGTAADGDPCVRLR